MFVLTVTLRSAIKWTRRPVRMSSWSNRLFLASSVSLVISNQARDRMTSPIKAGMSEAWREVMILPSTRTSESS
jgi:hypothetical protein